MSARPIQQKQRRRVAKALRRDRLPAYFDLVQWLLDRDYANTKRAAREIILAKRVRSSSHILGIETREVVTPGILGTIKVERKDVVAPFVPVSARAEIVVQGC